MPDETIKWEFLIDDKGSQIMQDFDSKTRKSMNSLSRSIKSKLGGSFKRLGGIVKTVGSKIFSLKTGIIALGTGLALRSLNRVVSNFEALAKTQEQAEAGLKQVLKSMGRFDEAKFEGIKKLASGLQATSTFGDEAIISGIKFLETYKNISDDAIPRAAQAMVDLAALTGRDMPTAANILGKAAMGMTGELRRYGITVDETIAKGGDFKKILGEIETQIKGQAKALRDTDSGEVEGFANVIDDVKEKFGSFTKKIKAKIAEEALPAMQDLNDQLSYWMESGEMEKTAEKWANTIIDTAKSLWENSKKWFEEFKTLIQQWKTDIPVVIEEAYAKLDEIQRKLFEGETLGERWEKVKKAVKEGISIEGPGFGKAGSGGPGESVRMGIGQRPEYGSITDLTSGRTLTFSDLPKIKSMQTQAATPTATITNPATGQTYSATSPSTPGSQITVNMSSSGSVAQDALTVRKELENLEKRGY